jgi:hypothetical protein
MVTTIAPGSVFVVREHGGYRAYVVCEGGKTYTGVRRALQPGEVVHRAVWKLGSRLESRQSYVLKSGDAAWVDTGIESIDFSKPPHPMLGHTAKGPNIWKNRFTGGPPWLREAS